MSYHFRELKKQQITNRAGGNSYNTAKIKMKTINFLNTELEINYTQALTSGYGHKKITVELYFQGEYKAFSATTSNMPDFDNATDLEGSDKDKALFNIISNQIEDQVNEWIGELPTSLKASEQTRKTK